MLTENEAKVLKSLKEHKGKLSIEELIEITGLPRSTIMSVIELLKSRGAIREETELKRIYLLTKIGQENLRDGLPEKALLMLLKKNNGIIEISKASSELGEKTNIAIGELKRRGAIAITGDKIVLIKNIEEELEREYEILSKIYRGEKVEETGRLNSLLRRKLIEEKIERDIKITYVPQVSDRLLDEAIYHVARLTSDDIVSGRWRTVILKEYNVEAFPALAPPGIEHFMDIFLEKVRAVLREMGFSEFNYDFVIQEFWNFDILFQAQDHPSREIHDTFWLDHKNDEIADANSLLIEKVKNIHERGCRNGIRGWGGEWKKEVSSRYILRTQMTSATIRALSHNLRPPFRVYSIGKVFRPDQIDYKRLPEFTQLDGIISEEGFSFRDLLSVLQDFFSRLGFQKVKFKPAYFPFTEPSVEGYVYFEGRGWIEVFGAGLFRPEILEVFNIEENVGAWGMGLERLAMKLLGVEDIRLFYTRETDVLRKLYSKALFTLGD